MAGLLRSLAATLPAPPRANVVVSAQWLAPVLSFHNMRRYGDPRYAPISDHFDHWRTDAVEAEPTRRAQALAGWAVAPSARLSHAPRAEEHLLPLMVVAGAASDNRGRRVFSDRVVETRPSAFCIG